MSYSRIPRVFLISLLALWCLALPDFAADNAAFIKAEIADTLITDAVFTGKFYFKNTGTKPWGNAAGETAVTLVSQNPKFNLSWGTYFIILGQGKSIAPGDTFAFTSPLKAPSTPGTYSMAWQCQNWINWDTTKAFFGDIGIKANIVVKARAEAPPQPYQHKDSLLDISDFEYAGSFQLPELPGEENLYTESGIALKTAGSAKHLLLRTGTYDYRLYEIEIPALVKIANGDFSTLKTAVTVRDWGDLGDGNVGTEALTSNGGFWFDDSTSMLYWSHYNGYFTGGSLDFPQIMATRLNTDGSKVNVGRWYIPPIAVRYKSYWGGVQKLTKRFADAYTNGRDMAVGFGGYYSICGSASRGPALGAIRRPNMTDSILDLVELVTYPDPVACPRQGNYLPQVGFWNDYPLSPWNGKWTYNDYCRAGVFIDLPDKQGYLAFTQQVIGRIGYDYGGYNTDGHTQNTWYFYDLKELGAVAKGLKSASSMLPASYANVNYPAGGGFVPGAAFDAENRLVYVYEQWGLGDKYPVVHAYWVKQAALSIKPILSKARSQSSTYLELVPNSNSSLLIKIAGSASQNTTACICISTLSGHRIAEWNCLPTTLSRGIIWDTSKHGQGLYTLTANLGGLVVSQTFFLAQ